MGIHNQIGQGTFSSIQEEVIVNIQFTSNWMRDQLSIVLSPYNLQIQHYNVLRIVNGKAPDKCSPGYIKAVMIDKKRDLTRLVDKLVQLDLLSRKTCPENRRKVDIEITVKGSELTTEIKGNLDKRVKELIHISDEEAELLSRLLDKLHSRNQS